MRFGGKVIYLTAGSELSFKIQFVLVNNLEV